MPPDPPARRADSQPHRNLALARGGARQQQVGQVGARNQQHEPGRRQQHDERLGKFVSHVRDTDRRGHGIELGGAVLLHGRRCVVKRRCRFHD
jgi:hypothetical protein